MLREQYTDDIVYTLIMNSAILGGHALQVHGNSE